MIASFAYKTEDGLDYFQNTMLKENFKDHTSFMRLVCIHLYIYTYIHTLNVLHTCVHAYLLTYIHTQACLHTCMITHIHIYIQQNYYAPQPEQQNEKGLLCVGQHNDAGALTVLKIWKDEPSSLQILKGLMALMELIWIWIWIWLMMAKAIWDDGLRWMV